MTESNSLQPLFIPPTTSPAKITNLAIDDAAMGELRRAVDDMPFNEAFDLIRSAAGDLEQQGNSRLAIDYIVAFDEMLSRAGNTDRRSLDLHAAMLQVLTALLINADKLDNALSTAASTLNILAREPKRKDEPFLSLLASLLYDITQIHYRRNEFRQAERAIEKSIKLFERLERINPERYTAPHILAVAEATKVYRSSSKQAKALDSLKQSAADSENAVNGDDATMQLIGVLADEGRTLAKMNKHREAIQYFTKALRMLTKLETDFSIAQLELSVELGISLLAYKPAKEKGVHLLNTMLHKATKMGRQDLYIKISEQLNAARTGAFDILAIWHKIFPR